MFDHQKQAHHVKSTFLIKKHSELLETRIDVSPKSGSSQVDSYIEGRKAHYKNTFCYDETL
jgi:hypothetical protein